MPACISVVSPLLVLRLWRITKDRNHIRNFRLMLALGDEFIRFVMVECFKFYFDKKI